MKLRRLFAILFSIQFVLVAAVGLLTLLLFRNEGALDKSLDVHFHSYLLADELRQSSDDLTRLARSYVATGNPEFEREYWAVLAIRDGKAPRPVDYNRIYWDFVAANGQKPRADGPAVSLQTLMVREGFTPAEFEKLKEAEAQSNDLVNRERIAMNAIKGLYDDGAGHFTVKKPPDRELAIRLMNDQAYHDAKVRIMRPIDDFYAMFLQRTEADVVRNQHLSRTLLKSIFASIVFVLLVQAASFVIIQRQITAQERAERALRKSEIDLATTLQTAEALDKAAKAEHAARLAVEKAHAELKEVQVRMVQAEKLAALGQLVAGVAHEINNPLAFVINNVAVLQRDCAAAREILNRYQACDSVLGQADPAAARQIAELAQRADLPYVLDDMPDVLNRSREGLRRIQQIVKDLRDFARQDDAGELAANIDLNAGIESTLNIVRGRAGKQNVEIKTDLATLDGIECYPARINQVILNLLVNAIDACANGGMVTIRSRMVPQGVQIEVCDTGCGIPPAIRGKIFDPFFTTKPLGQGTGLGLSISHGIVMDHGGQIEVESEVGRGSCFRVCFPRTMPPARRVDAPGPSQSRVPEVPQIPVTHN
jgi:signal transduction histidine kinase